MDAWHGHRVVVDGVDEGVKRDPPPFVTAAQQPQKMPQQGLDGPVAKHRAQQARGLGAALAEAVAVVVDQQGQMGKGRWGMAQGPVQQGLAGGRRQEVPGSTDFGDPLPGVVDDHGELVGKQPIPSTNHDIADLGDDVLPERAAQAVDDDRGVA